MTILPYLPQLFSGTVLTLILMLSSLALALVLATLMTMVLYSENVWLKKPVNLLIFFIRGTPLLVQIFLLYYGAGQFAWLRASPLWYILREPMSCAIIALSVNSACYTTIIFQGAIQSVPENEAAACAALGMSRWQAFWRIIFPRALRLAMPACSNEVLMILKGTSLASTITLLELMGVTQQLIARTYAPAGFYLAAGMLYLALNGLIMLIFRMLDKWREVPYN